MKEGKKEEPKANTNAWMTTYTDLMTLLLTFFVLLLSMSVLTEKKRLVALSSLVGAFGFKPGAQSIIGAPKGVNITMGGAPMKKEDIEFEKIRNITLKNALKDVSLIKEEERIILGLKGKVLFPLGASEIDPGSLPFLKEIAGILKESASLIELRGYAAFSETTFEPDPFKTSMMLSARRAFAVFRFFREECRIPPERMVAHGFGTHTLRKGDAKKKEEMNRQVEIIVDYGDRVPYHLRRQRGASSLEYKGFLFRMPGAVNE
ncbi:MAG: OmpA family protein [Deltaproteobacteria bacterium]|nr:OmpA family protein [Deltaproteobacteria bacterium]